MLLLLLNYVVLRALWKIDVHLISTLVNKSLYYSLFKYKIVDINIKKHRNSVYNEYVMGVFQKQ